MCAGGIYDPEVGCCEACVSEKNEGSKVFARELAFVEQNLRGRLIQRSQSLFNEVRLPQGVAGLTRCMP